MKRIIALVAVMLLIAPSVVGTFALAAEGEELTISGEGLSPDIATAGTDSFVPGEVIVRFREGALPSAIAGLLERIGAVVSERLEFIRSELLRVPRIGVERAIELLTASGLVEFAEPNHIRTADYLPNDTWFNAYQWNMKNPPNTAAGAGINMPVAWDIVHENTSPQRYGGDPDVIVAVIDTGIAYTDDGPYLQCPDLASTTFTAGYDYIDEDTVPYDMHRHGTHVCGTIAQATNNELAFAGIAHDCKVMPLRVLDHQGNGTDANLIRALTFAAANGADVVNMSLSGDDYGLALDLACRAAVNAGVVLCASSGNDGIEGVGYPAALPSCIAVGATGYEGERAYYSNYGPELDIVAPGGAAQVDKDYIYQVAFTAGQPPTDISDFKGIGLGGTSMACPHVAAVCALVKSVYPGLSAAQVREAVLDSAYDLGGPGWDSETGHGLLDAAGALQSLTVTAVDKNAAHTGETVNLTVSGTNFVAPLTVTLERTGEPTITATAVNVVNAGELTCTFDLAGANPGAWDLVVTREGLEPAVLQGGFSVLSPMIVTAVDKRCAFSGETVNLTVSGTSFVAPLTVTLERTGEPTITATSVNVVDLEELTCTFDLTGVNPGTWDLVVTREGLEPAVLQGAFHVDEALHRSWYLAEGSTAHGFETYILIENPSATDEANVVVTPMTSSGAAAPINRVMPPSSRTTIRMNDHLPGVDFSTMVTSDMDVICERAMYWNDRVEGTGSIGVQSPSCSWCFAEGSTAYGHETYLLIQNPGTDEATVNITYLTGDGEVQKAPLVVPAMSRRTVNIAEDLPNEDMSVRLVSDRRVIAERAMYWDAMRGGHDSIGTTSPACNWYLAEGTTSHGFQEWVLLGNPNDEDATVNLTWQTGAGPVAAQPLVVPAGSRVTVDVNAAMPGQDLSVQVESDIGVVAERAMYWDNGTGKAGHGQIAVPLARSAWHLAEGTSAWGFEEFICIQNPGETAANVELSYMTATGPGGSRSYSIEPGRRLTVNVGEHLVADVSALVLSDVPVVVERAMYWNGRGGGHVSSGLGL